MRANCASPRHLLFGVVIAASVGAGVAAAQDASRTYTDSRGRAVVFPLGDASFADEVVSFAVGTPPPRDPRWRDPQTILAAPDFNPRRVDPRIPANVVLGCGGALVVRFADNALVDVAGPDLYVLEVGPAIEPTNLAIRAIDAFASGIRLLRSVPSFMLPAATRRPPSERSVRYRPTLSRRRSVGLGHFEFVAGPRR